MSRTIDTNFCFWCAAKVKDDHCTRCKRLQPQAHRKPNDLADPAYEEVMKEYAVVFLVVVLLIWLFVLIAKFLLYLLNT
ncbi:hypothetical protein J4460_06375 [Candidatus Woesearchaeota archaeon]|nr:hypothetical protein [Candidatus Woesearchaeota archaeon]HIH38200.1 hypothetical protein [Candidatus Woesearchaeota archaeon]HIH49495.1 hypothetical protein [Candidatus Woesearchaeota archaeon]HIJ03877.1 hypothetical protein [Candidatus Woesearchaeota archaeon]